MTRSETEMVATVEKLLAVYSRGDLDAAAQMFDAEAELERPGGQAVLRGRAQIRAWMNPADTIRSLGAGSGIEFETVGWAVWTFTEAGLISRLRMILEDDADAAREATA